jgi:hypothetical protein
LASDVKLVVEVKKRHVIGDRGGHLWEHEVEGLEPRFDLSCHLFLQSACAKI